MEPESTERVRVPGPDASALDVERQSLKQLVHAGEAAPRALLDAVLHRRVALLGRCEAHRLRQLRLLTEIFELERLQVVHERLHEPLGRLDLVELALDDAERGGEPVGAAGAEVHRLDDGAVAPPFRDQLRIRPDREDVRAWRVEDPLDTDLELIRGSDGGLVHLSPPLSSRASRSWLRRLRSAPSPRRRSATWNLRRASRCR